MARSKSTKPKLPPAAPADPQPESRRFPALIRTSERVAQLARELAPMMDKSIAELVTDTLEPIFLAMRREEMKRRLDDLE